MSDLLLMQKSTFAIYKCCMFRYTVHFILAQDPSVPICNIFHLQMTFFHSVLQTYVLMIVYLIKYREDLFPQ